VGAWRTELADVSMFTEFVPLLRELAEIILPSAFKQ
jgi:hypothetical protein